VVDTTDVNGFYSFSGVLPGNYTLVATKEGYSDDTVIASTCALCPAEDVDLYLSSLHGVGEKPLSLTGSLVAHPNPFTQVTAIRFQVLGANASRLTSYPLRIYGLSGSLIIRFTIHNSQPISWDGRNESGVVIPAGLYFARINTVGAIKVVKVR